MASEEGKQLSNFGVKSGSNRRFNRSSKIFSKSEKVVRFSEWMSGNRLCHKAVFRKYKSVSYFFPRTDCVVQHLWWKVIMV